MRPSVAACLLLFGCLPDTSGFVGDDSDGGTASDGAVDGGVRVDAFGADLGTSDLGSMDGQVGPPRTCRPMPLPCLDASDPDVIEVPTEAGGEALQSASPGQIVQIRGLNVTGSTRVNPLVTVRGCEGATVSGTLWPQGSGGVIEGFRISGDVVLNRTGTYIVRDNVFVAGRTLDGASVEARSRDALVSAEVEALVERNRFEGVAEGITASTAYDTMTHRVVLTARNNVFVDVPRPIVVSEGGLVGEIEATIVHNTFVSFTTAVRFFSTETRPVLEANLFAMGMLGVATDSVYEGGYNMDWAVDEPHQVAPFGGSFATIPEPFVDVATHDYRLSPDSLATDAYGAGDLSDDFVGCPRPVGLGGGTPRYDVGAYETQSE